MGTTFAWVLVLVGLVLIAVAVAWAVNGNFRSQRLRKRFGPEYDRAVEQTDGDRKRAESILGERVTRWEELDLQPLSLEARDGYRQRWRQTQAEFVDQPRVATGRARMLLDQVIAERGYPVGDSFEERADLISVDHPEAVERYRTANRLQLDNSATDETATANEARRQAMLHYRALFIELLDAGEEQEEDQSPADVDLPELEEGSEQEKPSVGQRVLASIRRS